MHQLFLKYNRGVNMVYLNIKKILEEKGKSKYWLVTQMNSDYVTIGAMMENQTTSIHFETIDKLCSILECEPKDLIIRE